MRLAWSILVLLAACGDSHHIEAYWNVAHDDAAGTTIPCPSGWNTVRVIAADPNGGALEIASFPCSDGQGVTGYLPADYYNVHLEVWDGTKALAQSPPVYMDVLGLAPEASATFYVDAGFIDVAWTPCADDPTGTGAVLEVTPTTPSDISVSDTYTSCTAGALTGGPFRDGTYSVTFGVGDDHHSFDGVVVEGYGVTDLGQL